MPTGAMKVRLSNGERLEADLVISATGVKPNIGFLENSGVRCLVGVLTDEHLQTNVPGIYAAGDCAEAFDKVSGKTIVSAIQPNAADQARVAALNMLGQRHGAARRHADQRARHPGPDLGQLRRLAGRARGEHVELTDRGAGRHLSLQFDGDRLVGCNSIGWTDHVGVMRGLVEGQVNLAGWKHRLLADPTLLMQAYLASAQQQAGFGHVTGWGPDLRHHRPAMQITFKLYATLTDYLPVDKRRSNQLTLEVKPQATVAEVIAPFDLPTKLVHLVLINGHFVPPAERASRALNEGDVLAIWPPIAGG